MRSNFLKKSASLFLIVMILGISSFCSCLDSHAENQSPTASVASGCGAADPCPARPGEDHSNADHDAASCFCTCHLPLVASAIEIRHNPVVTTLLSVEKFSAIPEVYLDKFIPPQNLA